MYKIQSSISAQEFKKVAELIYRHAGIVLSDQKNEMVYNRLSRRLRELKISTFNEYIARLESNHKDPEWQCFVNALTTNLTSFFREGYHFPVLAEHARRRKGNYSVWCTASSTGEEPCSIAMTLNDVLENSYSGPRVWATDIDTDVLTKAKNGIYQLEDLQNISEEHKKKYFLKGTGAQRNLVKVRKELLDTIHYQQLNLMDQHWDIPEQFDAIFCRNILIYFEQKTQERLLLRFSKMLKKGGLLFLGHSESIVNGKVPFRLRGQSVYYLLEDQK